jgi:hypothetical protein
VRRAGVAASLIVAAALPLVLIITVLNLWLGDHALVLSFLRVMVWPAAVIGLCVWLRSPIQRKIDEMTKASYGQASLEFRQEQAATEILTEEIRAPAALLSSETWKMMPLTRDATVDDTDAAPRDSQAPATLPAAARPTATATGQAEKDEPARRAAIEKIIRDSAAWGHAMAGIGFKSTPIPVVSWSPDGSPKIDFGRSDVTPGFVQESTLGTPYRNDAAYARNLEREIKSLEDAEYSPMRAIGAFGGGDQAREARLKSLRERLRRADPNSAYLD